MEDSQLDDALPAGAAARPRLYVVLLSHLDTQWRWTERETIERHLPATVRANEALFARFPFYVLSFEGAYRYQLLQEHHPELFARLRAQVAAGRWFPAGAALEAFDANLPAPESLLRQILYGARWFERELGCCGEDLLLVDCFGFPASLPTLATHAGLAGFSTQKLRKRDTIRVAGAVPFAFGLWRGPDGSELAAALDCGEYGEPPPPGLARDEGLRAHFAALAAAGRPQLRLAYFGVGDRGGALAAEAVARLESELGPEAPIEVVVAASDRIFRDLGAGDRARLPVHAGDLLLRHHGTGCYTAKAELKRWNRLNERLARAAETAALLAARLGHPYPAGRLERAWTRFLVHQMHDDLTGTSIPAAYRISCADQGIAANELAEILLDAAGRLARALDLAGPGLPLLLFEPLGGGREALVEVRLDAALARPLRAVLDAGGRASPVQVETDPATAAARVLFRAATRATGCVALHLRDDVEPDAGAPAPPARAERGPDGSWQLDNGRLRARFDPGGSLASLIDRELTGGTRELLSAPLRLELLPDRSRRYPAWEIDWRDLSAPPRAASGRTPSIRVVESGPLRAALRVERALGGSRVVETWRLAAGAPLVEADVELDWRTRGALLKVAFPLAAASAEFLCDLGVGVARRPLASAKLNEVPAQLWVALADRDAGFGVAILSDTRAGWDHPRPDTLRLSLVHAPTSWGKFRHQAVQDFGRHRLRWALAGLPAAELEAGAAALAERFAHPPLPFLADGAASPGPERPRALGLLDLGAEGAALMALKRAEEGDAILLRLRETAGRNRTLSIGAAAAVTRVVELDGRERPRDPALAGDSAAALGAGPGPRFEVPLRPWSVRTLGLELEPAALAAAPPETVALPLGGRERGFTRRGQAEARGFDGAGRSFPLEAVPLRLTDTTVPFELAHLAAGGVRAGDGGTIDLPPGFAELWLLGAAVGGPLEVTFGLGDRRLALRFDDWRAPLAVPGGAAWGWPLRRRVAPGSGRRAPLAWFATALHDAAGRPLAGVRGHLFAGRLRLDGAGGALLLPRAPRLRLVAATFAREPARPVVEAVPPFE